MTFKSVLRSGVALASLMSASAQAGTLFLANLSAANEIPANPSTATGTGVLILNDAKTSAIVTGTHTVVPSTVVQGHIHRGTATVNGPVIFPFPSALSPIGPLTWAIPAADVINLENAGLYFNIHSVSRPGGEIRGQFIRAVLAPSATTDTQRAVAGALDVSAGFNADLDQVLIQTNLLSSATAKAQALEDISARSVYVQGRNAVESLASLGGSIFARAEDQRLSNAKPEEGARGFVTAGYDFGKRSTTAEGSGSKVERPFIVGGYDYSFGPAGSAGVAVGYADGKDKLKAGGGNTKVKTTAVQGFFSSNLDGSGLSLDGVVGYGWVKLNTSRNITSLARTATSSHDGKTWSAAMKLSKEFDMDGNMRVVPYAAVDFAKAKIDAYTEAGASSLGLVVPKISTNDSAYEIGATFAAPSNQSWGTLTPRLLVGARHVFDESKGAVSYQLVGSAVAFAAPVQHPGKTAARIEASISGEMQGGITTAIGYRGLVGGSDQSSHGIEGRVTFKF